MQTMISVIGVVTYAICLLGACWACFMAACRVLENLVDKIRSDSKEAMRLEIANDILCTSWWFSESKQAESAMKVYGSSLLKSSRCCSSTMREEWRKEVAKSKALENK